MLRALPSRPPACLATTRSEIEAFLAACSQPWREDHTNRDTRLTRNRIRHELLPLLGARLQPQPPRRCSAKPPRSRWLKTSYWQRTHCRSGVPLAPEGTRYALTGDDGATAGFLSSKVAMQRHALKQFLEWHGIKVDFHHVEAVRKCAVGAIPRASLPGSWQAERNGDWLELTPPPVQTPEPSAGRL